MTECNCINLLPGYVYLNLKSSGFPGWTKPPLVVTLARVVGKDELSINLSNKIDVISMGQFYYIDFTADDAMTFTREGDVYYTMFHFQNFEDYKTFIAMIWEGDTSTFYDVKPNLDYILEHSCYQCAYVSHGIIKSIWGAKAILAYSKWADRTAALDGLDKKYGDGTFLRGVRLIKHWSGCKLAWMVDVARLLVYQWLDDHPEDVVGHVNHAPHQHYYAILGKAECLYLDLC